ncbi:hypothetical protein EYC80_005317 [Monilinia laxa]|uniref:Uncharacterized protein n=1 Tax=Monilinia laxa TaxID=61186 RepID=A0A5N6KLA1_MONLA|nr:hypothetical protein EYC80_005317 [Monilinia laxa]
MCKVSSIVLQSAGCLPFQAGLPAHTWTLWTYRLCSISRDGRLCTSIEDINIPGDDYGSRDGSCRVCEYKYKATSDYEAAYVAAQRNFDTITSAAWSKKLEEEEAAKYVIDIIPFFDRRRRPRHDYNHHRNC